MLCFVISSLSGSKRLLIWKRNVAFQKLKDAFGEAKDCFLESKDAYLELNEDLSVRTLIQQVVIHNCHGSHGFYYGDGTRKDAGIVTSAGFKCDLFAVNIDGLLTFKQSCDGFEGYAEVNILSVGDTALYAAAMVCFSRDMAVFVSRKKIVLFATAHGDARKSCSVVETFCCIDAKHRCCEGGVQFAEDGFA